MLRSAPQLLLADEGERGAEQFVLDNRPLVDLLDLVEGPIGEFDPTAADRQAAVGIIVSDGLDAPDGSAVPKVEVS